MEKTNRLSFYDEIRKNKIYSGLLMFIVFIILLSLGFLISVIIGGDLFWIVLIISIFISISYILIGYYRSDKIALASVKAKPASQSIHREFYNIVEGLTLASGLPMPKLYIMEDNSINAFASGRDPKHAVICVTTGALQQLNKQELEGVLAHELSHIANYDIRFMTLTAVLVGMIAIMSEIFLRSLWLGGISRRDDREGGNIILIIIGIALAIIAPFIVSLVQLAISRKREFTADANAVKFVRSPTGLIGALQKIKVISERGIGMKVSGAVSPLFISTPAKVKELFSTHPPLDERIARLRRM
ncbi:MAG: M48 family metallopeptidase [Nanoarchaeota archaeon]